MANSFYKKRLLIKGYCHYRRKSALFLAIFIHQNQANGDISY